MVEGLEARMLLSGPPTKFVIPIGGTPGEDWAISAYTDQDPVIGSFRDYRGRQYTFDGSKSVHFAVTDYAAMDRGVDVYTAAPGTVLEVRDGQFDRRHENLVPTPADNYVLVDHGGGWQTKYGRLRNGSVEVSPGQILAAGQKVGLVGGSGADFRANQAGPFLKFEVMQDGQHVEPFLEPDSFWQSPPPFAGDTPGVHYMATAQTVPTNNAGDGYQVAEHIATRHVFHLGERVYVLTVWHGLNHEAPRQYRYFRPDGTQVTDTPNTTPDDRPQAWRQGFVTLSGANAQLGTWQVAVELNGIEIGRTSFTVADWSQGKPEIKLYQDNVYVIDGRTTPIDFGSNTQGGGVALRTFRVSNFGTAPLAIEQITLPMGFSMVTPPPATIPGVASPGAAPGEAIFVVRLDDGVAGAKGGKIIIRNSDAEEGEFDFAVKGTVVGAAANVTDSTFEYQVSPHRLRFTFDQDVGASLSAADVSIVGYAPGLAPVTLLEPVWDAATRTATFAVGGSGVLPDGNYRATLLRAGVLNGGTPMAADHVLDFFLLRGDANHDREVGFGDLVIVAQNYGLSGKTFGDGDFSYDGSVGFEDLVILAQRYGLAAHASAAAMMLSESEFLSLSETRKNASSTPGCRFATRSLRRSAGERPSRDSVVERFVRFDCISACADLGYERHQCTSRSRAKNGCRAWGTHPVA
jgi:hypothetical protein